jgi:UDP:flavonoid glycosyltransferase YjiC (YdhE family)
MAERRLKVFAGAIGDPGHALPVLALARELATRGHEVVMETAERWRGTVEALGIRFAPAEDQVPSAHSTDGWDATTLAEAARARLPLIRDFGPDVAFSDVYTLAPALAAEAAGISRATLVHHPYPVNEPGLPPLLVGFLPPRSPLGALMWRAAHPLVRLRLRLQRRRVDVARGALGLPPAPGASGELGRGLVLVGTFPQLEYPRTWPGHVRVTGPMIFDPPHSDVPLPPGSGPLVVVAASSGQDPERRLLRAALEALADEPVRVLATTSGGADAAHDVPENAHVFEWISYAQVMPRASLVVCRGGHGTVARALAEGVPVLVCPEGGDMIENGVRVAWAGAGLMLPGRLLAPAAVRLAARRLLADSRAAQRAREIAAWGRANHGPARGADLVERYAQQAAERR